MSVFSGVPSFSRPNWAEINLSHLRHNARELARVAGGAKLMAVVKAGAYGHGAYFVAHALESEPDVAFFGVASVDEGAQLRGVGIQKPILVLSGLLDSEAEELVARDLTATVFSLPFARALSRAALSQGKTARVHFKVNTGMHRLGAELEDGVAILRQIRALDGLEIEGVYTHLACADEENDVLSPPQLQRFTEFLRELNFVPRWRHAANSAGTLRYPHSHFDLVRPGIALYGANPCATLCESVDLKPVMTWKSRVTVLRRVGKGETASYGATWTAPRDSQIGIVACGYADGLSRALSNRGAVLVNGQRFPLVGRVTMDQILVDFTDSQVKIGDEVILFGDGLPVEEVAGWAGTISYELLCAVSARVPRVVISRA